MSFKILDIFEDAHWRLLGVNDFQYIVEQVSFLLVLKALAVAGDTEGLAREAGTKNLKVWDFVRLDLADIGLRLQLVILLVDFSDCLVDVAGHDALELWASKCGMKGS